MATIGLDKLYYAEITEDENGNETYGTPKQLAKAINADLSIELNEATLYADDGQAEAVKEFKSGSLSLGVDDIGHEVAAALVGATLDSNGVLISGSIAPSMWQSASGRKRQTASTNTIGSTGCCSEFLRPTWQRKATAFPSRHRPSRERCSAATNLTARQTIPGRRR